MVRCFLTYTYDALDRLLQVTDPLAEVTESCYDEKGRATGTTTTYYHGQGLISEETGGSYFYHHYNNLGSTMKLTDASGKVVASYTYGVYGELLSGNADLTHLVGCKSVKKMKESNTAEYTGTRDEVIVQGYSPCGNCHP